MKRFLALAAAAGAMAAVLIGGASGASGASSLPTLSIALDGSSIAVGGALQSGAVNIRITTTKESDGSPYLIRLNPGVTPAQLYAGLAGGAGSDPNNVSQYGSIVVNADAPSGTSDIQTTLQPGQYVAFDGVKHDPSKWPTTSFTISKSGTEASLPAAQATVRAIDFAFTGASKLHAGELVRFQNDGFLVHMIVAERVKNARAATKVTQLLRAGRDTKAGKLATGFANFMQPVSHGAVQQFTVTAKPGVYVLACFMDTQDHREHTRLGMLRTIRITH